MNGAACTVFTNLQLSWDQLFSKKLTEMPVILDTFCQLVNNTSTSIGVV